MLQINSQEIVEQLILSFPNLEISLDKEGLNEKVSIKSKSGASIYFYPQNIYNFEKIYGKQAFSTQQQYVDYIINDIQEFYGEIL